MWQTFVSSLRVYEPLTVGGADDPHEGRYDFDGAEEKKKPWILYNPIIRVGVDHCGWQKIGKGCCK